MPIFVNDVEITDDEVHREMQYHPASNVDEARHKAAEALVIRELFLQEAKELNLLEDDPGKPDAQAEEEAIESLLEQEITLPDADTETCQHYFEQNKERFTDQKKGGILPFEQVESLIRDYMYIRSMRTGVSQYIAILAGKAKIAGFHLEGANTSRVQ